MAEPKDIYIVTKAPLKLTSFTQEVSSPAWGAVCSFLGTVRSPNLGQLVDYIDYEGYEPMLKTQMGVLSAELRSRFELGGVLLAHRLGRLLPGEASIAVVVSSAHRRDALEACAFGINRAKELLPVWKLEVTQEDRHWVAGSSAASEPLP